MTELKDIVRGEIDVAGPPSGVPRLTREQEAINALNAAVRELQGMAGNGLPPYPAPEGKVWLVRSDGGWILGDGYDSKEKKSYTVAEMREKAREYDMETQANGPGAPTIRELIFLDWLEKNP